MPILSLATPRKLRAVLARGAADANELSTALQLSTPTLHRLLSRLADATVTAGKAGGLAPLPVPVHAVDTVRQVSAAVRREEGALCGASLGRPTSMAKCISKLRCASKGARVLLEAPIL